VHWGDVVPAWLGVIFAAVFSIQSWRSSPRSKAAEVAAKAQAKVATGAAEKAVAAQEQIAAATNRLADATDRQWDAAEENPWRIERGDKDGFDRLHNLTATTKYHVRLLGDPVRVGGQRTSFREIAGNDSPRIDLVEPWRVLVNKTVTVSWYPTKEQAGEPKRQRIQL
jgi:hypothetical protein